MVTTLTFSEQVIQVGGLVPFLSPGDGREGYAVWEGMTPVADVDVRLAQWHGQHLTFVQIPAQKMDEVPIPAGLVLLAAGLQGRLASYGGRQYPVLRLLTCQTTPDWLPVVNIPRMPVLIRPLTAFPTNHHWFAALWGLQWDRDS